MTLIGPHTPGRWRSRWKTPDNGVVYGQPCDTRKATDTETTPPAPGARRAGSQFEELSQGPDYWITDKRTDDYR